MESIDFTQAAKARQLKNYFQQHGRIYIVVDASREDCIVPQHLKHDPALSLVLNTRMPQAIEIDANGVRSRFSFSGQPFDCHIPLAALWAAYLPGGNMEDGLIWEQDVPAVVRTVLDMVAQQAAEQQATDDADSAASTASSAAPEPAPVPRLRIVK